MNPELIKFYIYWKVRPETPDGYKDFSFQRAAIQAVAQRQKDGLDCEIDHITDINGEWLAGAGYVGFISITRL